MRLLNLNPEATAYQWMVTPAAARYQAFSQLPFGSLEERVAKAAQGILLATVWIPLAALGCLATLAEPYAIQASWAVWEWQLGRAISQGDDRRAERLFASVGGGERREGLLTKAILEENISLIRFLMRQGMQVGPLREKPVFMCRLARASTEEELQKSPQLKAEAQLGELWVQISRDPLPAEATYLGIVETCMRPEALGDKSVRLGVAEIALTKIKDAEFELETVRALLQKNLTLEGSEPLLDIRDNILACLIRKLPLEIVLHIATFLPLASQVLFDQVVEAFLIKTVDPRQKDAGGLTPLEQVILLINHSEANSRIVSIVRSLLSRYSLEERKGDIESLFEGEPLSLLERSVGRNSLVRQQVVQLLLERAKLRSSLWMKQLADIVTRAIEQDGVFALWLLQEIKRQIPESNFNRKNKFGFAPLHLAASLKQGAVITELLTHNDLNVALAVGAREEASQSGIISWVASWFSGSAVPLKGSTALHLLVREMRQEQYQEIASLVSQLLRRYCDQQVPSSSAAGSYDQLKPFIEAQDEEGKKADGLLPAFVGATDPLRLWLKGTLPPGQRS